MSLQDLEKAFELLNSNFNLEELDFCGEQSLSTISAGEVALGLKFPETYKYFLKKCGCGGFDGVEVYGIIKDESFAKKNMPVVGVPNIVWSTLQWHRDFNHPLYLPIIYNVGEGTLYCLDTSQMNDEGECPVVAWPIGGYEETPVLEIVAEDFGKFFLDLIEREIEYKKSQEES